MTRRRHITIALVALLGMTASVLPVVSAAADTIPVGSVTGVVTTAAGPLPTGTLRVIATTDGYNAAGASGQYGPFAVDSATGAYTIPSLATGRYFLSLEYLGTENYPFTTYSPAITAGGGRISTNIVAGAQSADFYLAAGATISGNLTTSDGTTFAPHTPGLVRVVTATGGFVNAGVSIDSATGAYVASRIPAGDVTVQFVRTQSEWITEYWDSATNVSAATLIHLDEATTVTGIDAVVHRKPVIRGTVTFEGSGAPVTVANISTYRSGDAFPTYVSTSTSGAFETYPLDPGEYTVCIAGGANATFVPECWNDSSPVALVPDQVLDLDWEVVAAGNITGTVAYFSEAAGSMAGADGTNVTLYRLNEAEDNFEWYGESQAFPAFSFTTLPPGTYALHFYAPSAFQNELLLNSEYWEDARYWATRSDLEIEAGETVNVGQVVLSPRTFDTERIDGLDRFDVGVSVSKKLYPVVPSGGVPVVYVASGYNFPDALTAGPAAALQDGVVLLVEPGAIPAAVAAELTRLRPQRIVVAGGPASVTPAVYEQLKDYVASPSDDVFRANGIDRYAASEAVVRDAFAGVGADMAIITTGANFPDALSAGPAAASQNAPVIMVDGSASSINSATRQLLRDLNVDFVFIAGGTGSVSPGIEASLKQELGSDDVWRFAGADRFEVGVLISQVFFPSAEYTFIATGYKFPDALTGGPLAAAYGGPLYLSPPECIPPAVAYDILDLDAQAIILLGGPASLTSAVEDLELC